MAVCALRGPDGLELQPVALGDACAGVLLLQPADVPPNPLLLSYEDGLAVSAAIAGVWLSAWGVRVLFELFRDKGE